MGSAASLWQSVTSLKPSILSSGLPASRWEIGNPTMPLQVHAQTGARALVARRRRSSLLNSGAFRLLLMLVVGSYAGLWGLRMWWTQHTSRQQGTCAARLEALGLMQTVSITHQQSELPYNTLARRKLYADMGDQLHLQGLPLGRDAVLTQGLHTSDLFATKGDHVQRILRPLDVAVRAVVMPLLDSAAAAMLREALLQHLLPLLPPDGIWLQDETMLHTTLFHASSFQHPVPLTQAEVIQEVAAVQRAGRQLCPLHIALERIVATSSGNILACWQVVAGSDPAAIRRALRAALTHAPEQQSISEPAILHTTLARLLRPPNAPRSDLHDAYGQTTKQQRQSSGHSVDGTAAEALETAVTSMTQQLCGLQASMRELWYVEEEELLALALAGHFRKHSIPLKCVSA